ncbi:MAG: hypothetical protein ACI9UN_002182 [Granulosicoccus sp.]|jgi:hypothetical protein
MTLEKHVSFANTFKHCHRRLSDIFRLMSLDVTFDPNIQEMASSKA